MSSTFSTINGVLTATITGTATLGFEEVSGLITDSNGNKATAVEIEGYSNISSYSFYNTPSVTSITVGNSVTTLGLYAFRYSSLSSFTIPATLTTIDPRAFDKVSTLTSITVASGNTNYSSNNGVLFDYSGATLIQYPLGNTRTSYEIPANVTTIEQFAFRNPVYLASYIVASGNTNYSSNNGVLFDYSGATLIKYPIGNTRTSYEIPAGVETIGFQAFRSASHLTSITMPSSVTSIDTSAFFSATGLTSINIPASVTSIGQSAFGGSGLTSITIPSSVTSLGSYAFQDAQALTSVTFEAGSQITTIGNYTFSWTGLTSITIPSGVTTIGSDAFNSTSSLTWVAFEENSQLTTSGLEATVFINSSVATIYASQPLIDTMGWTRSDSTDPPTLNNIGGKSDINVSTPPAQALPAPICFPAGTPILTDQGEVDIDKIDPEKHTIRSNKIEGITETVAIENYVVMIKKDAFSKTVPCRDTTISANHKIMFNNQMIQACEFVDKNMYPDHIYKIPYSGYTLYNVLLEDKHDLMIVNSLIAETLSPTSVNAWLFRKLKSDISNAERKEVMDAYMQRLFPAPVISSFMVGCK